MSEHKTLKEQYEHIIDKMKTLRFEDLHSFTIFRLYHNLAHYCAGSTIHTETDVWHPMTQTMIPIDHEIADVVGIIWKFGINTVCSCQGNPPKNYALLEFDEINYKKFMNRLFEYFEKYNLDIGKLSFDEEPDSWIINMKQIFYAYGKSKPDEDKMGIYYSVKFPKSDIDLIKSAFM